MALTRTFAGSCSLLLLLAASAAAQAPVIRPGECIYLYGAPPGEPAAPTEEFRSGTHVYEGCTYPAVAQVGRDEPHRLTIEMPFDGAPAHRGCLATAWAEHRFAVEAGSPVEMIVSAVGQWSGYLEGHEDGWVLPAEAWLVLSAIEIRPDDTERVITSAEVARRQVEYQRLTLDEPWSRSLHFKALPGQRVAVRLELWGRGPATMRWVDFGVPGTGRGAGYSSIDACVLPVAATGSTVDDDIERDLYEKRCLPSLWLPSSSGGRLEAAMAVTQGLIDRAVTSGDAGANVTLARQRHDRALEQSGRGQYQHACRSLSDAIRALTTP